MSINFGELKKGAVFVRNKKWYKKMSKEYSNKKFDFCGYGESQDDNGRINFFSNNQKVDRYELR